MYITTYLVVNDQQTADDNWYRAMSLYFDVEPLNVHLNKSTLSFWLIEIEYLYFYAILFSLINYTVRYSKRALELTDIYSPMVYEDMNDQQQIQFQLLWYENATEYDVNQWNAYISTEGCPNHHWIFSKDQDYHNRCHNCTHILTSRVFKTFGFRLNNRHNKDSIFNHNEMTMS